MIDDRSRDTAAARRSVEKLHFYVVSLANDMLLRSLLTKAKGCAKPVFAMNKATLIAAVALLALPLAACENKPETVTSEAPDPQKEELAKRPKIELPPSIKASVTMRCKDNSLVYIDFFSGDKQANLRTEKDGQNIHLTAEKAGDPLVADGYTLKGDSKLITLTQPGKPAQTCKR